MSAGKLNCKSEHPNLNFPPHHRFASLLHSVVIAGLALGALAFLLTASAVTPKARLVADETGLAAALLAFVFVFWKAFVSLRPWRRLASMLGCGIMLVLVLQLCPVFRGGMPLLSLLPRLASFVYSVLIAAALLAYLSHRMNEIYGLVGALLFLATPALLVPTGMDLSVVFYASAAVLCVFLWSETAKVSWLVAAGLGIGFAAASLCWMAALLGLASGLAVAAFVDRRGRGWPAMTGYSLILALCGVVPYVSWQMISLVSDPAGGFTGHAADAASGAGCALGQAGVEVTPWTSIVQAIFAVPLSEESVPATLMVGPAMICFLPWAFRGKWGNEKRALSALVLAFVVFTASAGALKSIGLLPIIPLLATLATYAVHNLYMGIRHPVLLVMAVAAFLAWNGLIYWSTLA